MFNRLAPHILVYSGVEENKCKQLYWWYVEKLKDVNE